MPFHDLDLVFDEAVKLVHHAVNLLFVFAHLRLLGRVLLLRSGLGDS
jgi:hypothetical protein